MLRITALCRRFVSSAKNTAFITNDTSIDTQLELEQSKKFWIRMGHWVQQAYFSHEIRFISRTEQLPKSNPLIRLTSFLDGEELLRVGG